MPLNFANLYKSFQKNPLLLDSGGKPVFIYLFILRESLDLLQINLGAGGNEKQIRKTIAMIQIENNGSLEQDVSEVIVLQICPENQAHRSACAVEKRKIERMKPKVLT